MPTVDDVLHVRKPTTGGVFEYQFTLDNTLFRLTNKKKL
jgi:hypothetical protein